MSDSAFPFGHFSVAHYHGVQVYKDINFLKRKDMILLGGELDTGIALKCSPQKKILLLTYHFLTTEKPAS